MLRAASAAAVLVATTGLVAFDARPVTPAQTLLLDGVAVVPSAGGAVVHAVPAGSTRPYFPGTRVPLSPELDALQLAGEQRTWLAAGTVPGSAGPWEEMVTCALLDIHSLGAATFPTGVPASSGAVVAGWLPSWRYVWPRDAAFAAVALARTGHGGDAVALLAFLQSEQRPDGTFAARYHPDGGAVDDGRADQSDAVGLVLWATAAVLAELPAAERAAARAELAPLVDRASALLMRLTTGGLPPVSSDSWELREDRLTVGTAASALAGLEAAGRLTGADAVARRAAALRTRIELDFGAVGYRRYAGPAGSLKSLQRQGADANVALLLPPFQPRALAGSAAAWERSLGELRRPAGGLAPGSGWRNDGASWTPQTTLYAWVAAENGQRNLARELLDWTDTHRTGTGAIPEKVTAEGRPRSVAPLTWAAANAVLAVEALGP